MKKHTKEELYKYIIIDKLSYEEIGRMYNISGASVKKAARRYGIELPKRRCINDKETFNKGKELKSKLTCKHCGKELKSSAKTFCDTTCQTEFNRIIYINKWKEGLVSGLSCSYGLSIHIKHYIKEKYDNKCANCGWNEINPYTNKIPLEIEHIDGNYLNNKEENLILLCPNCHSLTSTYKGANRGNGRKGRDKYYV